MSGACVCRRGYDRNPATGACEDINECLTTAKPVCGADAVCKNLPGSYECECPTGFSGNPFSRCDRCAGGACACQPPYQVWSLVQFYFNFFPIFFFTLLKILGQRWRRSKLMSCQIGLPSVLVYSILFPSKGLEIGWLDSDQTCRYTYS